jgi:RNA polymerase sigma factor (sigma-70 family)
MTRLLHLLKTDAQLVEAIRTGDDAALAILYNKNIRMVIKYFLLNHGSEEEAREYLQDALVIFWEKVRNDQFTLKSKISTFLFAIIKNRWLRELARRKKHTDLDAISGNPGSAASAESEYEGHETAEIVRNCMAKLTPLCRKILTYYYYDQLSMAEISTLTGLANENVAKAKKYQCKKALEDLVKEALA